MTAPHRSTSIGALAATIALVASACAGSTDTDRTGAAPEDVEMAALQGTPTLGPNTDVLPWSDGFNHFVVTTTDDTIPAEPTDARVELSSVDRLFTTDGPVSIDVPPESLRIIAPTSEFDEAALAKHAGATVAFLVEDADGVVTGTPAIYIYTPNGLHALDATAPAPRADGNGIDTDIPDGIVASELDRRVGDRIGALDGTVEVTIVSPGLISVTTEDSDDDLAAVPGVGDVHDDVTFGFTDDPMQNLQWALDNTGAAAQANGRAGTPGADIDAPDAWNASRGAGIVVAVIDSGVQLDHPDLAGRYHTNDDEVCGNGIDDDANGFVDDCDGWDFGAGDANPSPDGSSSDAGHGTHVAGLIAAGENGVGVVGVAPEALIMPIKVARPDGAISTAALTGAIDYAAANGADVINMSLGTNPGVPRGAVSAIEASVARAVDAGVVVVAAAGNNGVDITNQPVWPSSLAEFYPGVINVGSSNNNDGRSFFSNFGAPLSIWAPGEGMLSTGLDSRHEWRSGTSMATPVVAGAAALVLANEALSPGDVRTRLQTTGAQTAAGTRLDAAAAVGASTATSVSVAVRGADTLRPDTAATLSIDVSARNAADATQVRVSMATLDQGAVAAVGDLTARITSPSGSIDAVTDAAGAFPVLPLVGDLDAGFTIGSQLAMPAGQYAVVTELLSAGGQAVGEPQVVYLTVADQPATPVTTTPPTTEPAPTPPTNTTPPTTSPAPSPTPTTPAPAPATPTAPAAPTTVAPSPIGPTVPTTTPPAVTDPTPIGPETPSTTAPAPDTPAPAPTPTTPAPTTPTTTPPAEGDTTPPATAPPATAPPSTTPAPAPDVDGEYRLTSMSPRSGSTLGGDFVVLDGEFPTNVPVYVWWDELAVVAAHINTGSQLTVRTPAVVDEGVTDVTVRFTTSDRHELTLRDAFTFVAPGDGNAPAPTPTPTPTDPSPTTPPSNGAGPDSGTSNPTTPSPSPTTPSPVTTTPTDPSPTPPDTSPAPTPPGTADPAPPDPNNWTRDRGSLTLRPPTPGSAIASLTPASWQPGCAAASCDASKL